MDTMKVQAQIRQNAEEVSSYLSDMSKWEKNANKRVLVKKSSTSVTKALPVRLGSGTVKVIEKVPVTDTMGVSTGTNPLTETGFISSDSHAEAAELTPSSLVTSLLLPTQSISAVPAARGVANLKDAETSERERGNTEFEVGNFAAAVKCYSKCLGLKSRNYIAFSNRAMAYMKLREFFRAESDCTSALCIEPTHVKSLIRRATCRNALGKHRAALLDLTIASDLEPSNKQIRGELQRTREFLRSAVNRAPLVSIATVWLDNSGDQRSENMPGPDLPYTPHSLD